MEQYLTAESWCANLSKISGKCGLSPCFCTAEPKKVPQAQEPRAWDISNKSSANAKEGPDQVPIQNIHMPQC